MSDKRAVSTPIYDFIRAYAASDKARMHMPGHKGHGVLGVEGLDITEVEGADTLYCPTGIIAESEANATALFGSQRTFYSCGGSSHCVFSLMWLLAGYAASLGRAPLVVAARNVHQSFVSALAQTGMEVSWLRPDNVAAALACPLTAVALESHLRTLQNAPIAVYITSPDYFGNMQPVAELAEVCHRHGVLLAVDNAHGAYLHFLSCQRHPLDFGADVVCDSAHKTLPVLTGGAYLHFGATCPQWLPQHALAAMLTMGTTSPSYLIMGSLDYANLTLRSESYLARLQNAVEMVRVAKRRLQAGGWQCLGDEPLKIALDTAAYGYTGEAVAEWLAARGVMVEYAAAGHVVMMVSADTPPRHLDGAIEALLPLPRREALPAPMPLPSLPPVATTVRKAYLAPRTTLPLADCVGRTLAYLRVSCPPAVPPVIAGEVLTPDVLRYLAHLGYTRLDVIDAAPTSPFSR